MDKPSVQTLQALTRELQAMAESKQWESFQALDKRWADYFQMLIQYEQGAYAQQHRPVLEALINDYQQIREQLQQEKDQLFGELSTLRNNQAGIKMYQNH